MDNPLPGADDVSGATGDQMSYMSSAGSFETTPGSYGTPQGADELLLQLT